MSAVSHRQFWTSLNISTAESLDGGVILPNYDLGGISGGCCFRVIEDGLIARLELMSIIAEGSNALETTLAHPLTSLKLDGTFYED